MIAETSNINNYIARARSAGIYFNKLTATFNSRSLRRIQALGLILESDGISYNLRRVGLWSWKLTMEIPITDKYNEDEYKKIIGSFFLLASRCAVDIGIIGLIG